MKPANQVVNMLLETGTQRVCAACEKEFGPVPAQPGTQKSHGICRRHMADAYREAGFPEKVAELEQKPDDNFPPDLAQLPTHGKGAVLDPAFGIQKDNPVDAVDQQRKLRSEWE